MRFWWLYGRAIVRGWLWRWPSMPPVPEGYSGVSCALNGPRECRDMYRHGWEPWSVQRIPGRFRCGRVARSFRVRLTPEEVEWRRLADLDLIEIADRHEREMRAREMAANWHLPSTD